MRQDKYALLVGLDWADREHVLMWRDTATGRTGETRLRNRPEAIAEWVADRLAEHPDGRIAVCLEQSRGPVVHALMGYPEIDLYPVNPAAVARYRGVLRPSGAKDDPGDAAVILDLLERHRDLLTVWRPDTPATRLLRSLCEDRRRAVGQRAALCNSLRAKLKEYYPQALDLGGEDLYSEMTCAWLSKWPRIEAAAAARPDTVRRFCRSLGCRSEKRIQERLDLLASARPLTDDPAVVEAGVRWTALVVSQVRALNRAIAEYDRRIAEVFEGHPEAELFAGLPGAGDALAPRLAALFGTDRGRFESAEGLATFTGVAPVVERSGERMWTHWRWRCPRFLRQTLVEFAGHSIRRSAWAGAYYDDQRARGKDHQAAVRALAYKWVRVLFRCWRDGVPYDEGKYIEALRRRGSWIATRLESAAA